MLSLALGLSLAGCGILDRKDDGKIEGSENSPEGETFLIGLVELVNPDQRFVLIRTQSKVNIPAGHILSTLDATGARGRIKVSPEKKPNLITADIIEGNPRIGNIVSYQPKMQGAQTPASPAAPSDQPMPLQPPPISPVTPSEFLSPDGLASQPSPIPTQTIPLSPPPITPSPAADLAPLPVELPPVVK